MRPISRLKRGACTGLALIVAGALYAAEPTASKLDTACATRQAQSPEQQVGCVMRAYIEVTKQADAKRARELFHATALMSGDLGSGARTGSAEPFFKSLESAAKRPGEAGYQAHVGTVSVLGNTATGEVIEQNLFGYNFANRFHLLKIDGRWLIISKLFYAEPIGAR